MSASFFIMKHNYNIIRSNRKTNLNNMYKVDVILLYIYMVIDSIQ